MPIDLTNVRIAYTEAPYSTDLFFIKNDSYAKIHEDMKQIRRTLLRSTNSKPKPTKKRTSLSLYREKLQQPK